MKDQEKKTSNGEGRWRQEGKEEEGDSVYLSLMVAKWSLQYHVKDLVTLYTFSKFKLL